MIISWILLVFALIFNQFAEHFTYLMGGDKAEGNPFMRWIFSRGKMARILSGIMFYSAITGIFVFLDLAEYYQSIAQLVQIILATIAFVVFFLDMLWDVYLFRDELTWEFIEAIDSETKPRFFADIVGAMQAEGKDRYSFTDLRRIVNRVHAKRK